MNPADRAVWVEIGSLALYLSSLIFLLPAGYLGTVLFGHWILTSGASIEILRGVWFGRTAMILGVFIPALGGVFFLIAASTLRLFFDDREDSCHP